MKNPAYIHGKENGENFPSQILNFLEKNFKFRKKNVWHEAYFTRLKKILYFDTHD